MAGDWMKIELELPDKPEVHSIASMLNLDPDAVVGKLIRIWQWFDKHTTDGNAYGVTYSLPDRISGVTGFAEAMVFVGWLEQNDKTLTMPKFERHTSNSAKTRALTQKRVSKTRNAVTVTEALPEKRREEKSIDKQSEKPSRKKRKTLIAKDFGISDSVREWANERGHTRLEERLAHFIAASQANAYEYADWDAAFRNAISGDWAKIGGPSKSSSGSYDKDEFLKRIGAKP